tara:strand:+ start:615 stop:1316 length:702 start_codon:yes stop_codon:yes gene_type:complete
LNISNKNIQLPSLFYEKEYIKKSKKIMIGVDEVGRGSWAGPIISCASFINPSKFENLPYINDSKKMKRASRREIYFSSNAFSTYSVASATVNEIENFGINACNDLSALRAILCLINTFNFNIKKNLHYDIYFDGNRLPKFEIFKTLHTFIKDIVTMRCVIKGDSKVMSIALSSILAKETRDIIMNQYHKSFPFYNFKNNVGYGTKEHKYMIQKYGITKVHRKNFKPINTIFCN